MPGFWRHFLHFLVLAFVFKKQAQCKRLEKKYTDDYFPTETASRRIHSDPLLSQETLTTLANALGVHPCIKWKLKHRFKSGRALGIDESKLGIFIDHPRNERLVRKLHKVLQGEDVHLTVIGGSNSGGAGVQEDEQEGASGVFPYVIRDWWEKTITPVTGSELNLNLVSIGGTASDFYQYCYHVYLKDGLDLVILESSVNDLNVENPDNVNRSVALEQLTRQLLLFSTQPALIYLNLFHGSTHMFGCKNLEDYGQRALSHAYKITSIRWRDLVCPLTLGKFRTPLNGIEILSRDRDHINLLGHAQVSLMLINLIREILWEMITPTHKDQLRYGLHDKTLPEPVYINTLNNIISNPLCWTTITPNYKNTTIKSNLKIDVVKNTLFKFSPLIRLGYPCGPPRMCRADAYSGWVGSTVGATLIVSFTVPRLPPGEVTQTRSVIFVTRDCSYCGVARVWIDNDFENGKIVVAKKNGAHTSVNIIGLHINPGIHTLSINVVESGNVTLAGLMLGPPDGPY